MVMYGRGGWVIYRAGPTDDIGVRSDREPPSGAQGRGG